MVNEIVYDIWNKSLFFYVRWIVIIVCLVGGFVLFYLNMILDMKRIVFFYFVFILKMDNKK